jgi:hypothetical protein
MSNYFSALNARSRALNQRYGLPKKKTTTPATKPAAMTAEQWARLQAEKYIQSQIDSINQNRELYLQDLRKQSDLEAARGLELSKALQAMNMPGRIQQIYGDASANIGGLAQGFSGALRDQATADTAQQTRMVSGTGQEGAVRNAGEAMGNVTYGLGGYIPARNMAESGAAFASQAALEPGFAVRMGQQKASEVYQDGLSGLDEFTRAANEARSGRFEIEQELLGMKQDEVEAARKYTLSANKDAYSRLKSERDFLVKQAYLALASGDRKRSNEYLRLAKQKETRMTAQAQGVDPDGDPLPGYKRNPDGTISKVTTAKTPAQKAAEKAKTNRASARKEREDEFRKSRLDAIDEAKKLIVPATTLRPEQRPSWQVAYSRLWNRYKDLLRFGTAGGSKKLRARIDQLIREALLQNGFKEPVKTPARSTSGPNSSYR